MLTITYFLLTTILTDSSQSNEQLAADYFFKTIWEQKYVNYKSLEFDYVTDTSIYVGHVYGCKEWNDGARREIEKIKKKN